MRNITTITLAATLALSLTGPGWAQGTPGVNGSGGSTTGSSASERGNGNATKGDTGAIERSESMQTGAPKGTGETAGSGGGAGANNAGGSGSAGSGGR